MGRIGERFLTLLGKGELGLRQVVLLRRGHCLGAAGRTLAVGPGTLHLPCLGDVAAGRLFLSSCGHVDPSRQSDVVGSTGFPALAVKGYVPARAGREPGWAAPRF